MDGLVFGAITGIYKPISEGRNIMSIGKRLSQYINGNMEKKIGVSYQRKIML